MTNSLAGVHPFSGGGSTREYSVGRPSRPAKNRSGVEVARRIVHLTKILRTEQIDSGTAARQDGRPGRPAYNTPTPGERMHPLAGASG